MPTALYPAGVMTLHLTGPTLDRLAALAAQYGTDPDTLLGRLLDRDPHDHEHRCPTCSRLAVGDQQRVAVVAEQHDALFLVGSEPCGADPYGHTEG